MLANQATAASASSLVEARSITKRFGGVLALEEVSLELRAGEVHCLVGENGAGKSTLGKVISGVVQPDSGQLFVDGNLVNYQAPREALGDGITIVEQELALVPAMTVSENVLLGLRPVDLGRPGWGIGRARSAGRRYVAELAEQYDLQLNANARVEQLPVAEQQKVEILRALARQARVIVMDEPTARLAGPEAQNLLRIIRRLAAGGTAVVYVSHFLEEVLSIADRVTVLRNGRFVKTVPASGETPTSLVTAMLGRDAQLEFPAKRPVAASTSPVLRLKALGGTGAVPVQDLTFDLRPGEILGLAGLVGSGRSEAARLIFGADRATAGTMEIAGREGRMRSIRAAIDSGIAYLPEDRKDLGLFMTKSVQENVTLPALSRVCRAGMLQPGEERRATREVLARLTVHPNDPRSVVGTMSGGNQQKVLFGKWLWHEPRVLIADEPTRGVDIGAKFAIYELMAELAADGLAILLISSDMDELVGLAHRVVVLARGRQVADLDAADVRADKILQASFGHTG